MTPEDRALLHMLKEFEQMGTPRDLEDEITFLRLQNYFGVLDPYSEEDAALLGELLLQKAMGKDWSP